MSATAPLVLYGERLWDSAYVFTAFVALREKGLPFEMRVLNLQEGDLTESVPRALWPDTTISCVARMSRATTRDEIVVALILK